MCYEAVKIAYMLIFGAGEAVTLEAVFYIAMFHTAFCNFAGLVVNATAGTVPR